MTLWIAWKSTTKEAIQSKYLLKTGRYLAGICRKEWMAG